jgi:hypothetical protein
MGCKATTKAGNACKSTSVQDNGFCFSHQPAEVRESKGFSAEAGHLGGRPRRPRLSELYAEVAEEKREEIRAVLDRGLQAKRSVVVGNGPTAHVQEVEDIPTQLKTVAEITDRTDGKARQSVELTGDEGGPIEFAGLPTSGDWNKAVAKVLSETGAHGADPDQDQ